MVWIFGVLATLPILLVYFFAVQFLNRGIDSWFNVEIRRSLDDALVLSRSALEVRMREQLAATDTIADEVQSGGGPAPGLLESLRQQAGALELTAATESGSLVAVSRGLSGDLVPEALPDEVLLQVRQGRPFVSLEPQSNGGYLVRTAVALRSDMKPFLPWNPPSACLCSVSRPSAMRGAHAALSPNFGAPATPAP